MHAGGWEPITSLQQYYSFVEAQLGTVVFFTAAWCLRCIQVARKVNELPGTFPKLRFYTADLEECPVLGELLQVATLPTCVLLSAGSEAHRLEGVPQQRPARALAQAIQRHLLGEGGCGVQAAAGPPGGAVPPAGSGR